MAAEVQIDHVLYAVADLDEAAARFADEHGFTSTDGGRHPGHGTANRIVPLGSDYIELIAVVDTDEASESPLGRAVSTHIAAAGDGLLGWAVRTDELDAHAERLSLPVQTMSRDLPDGRELSWDLAGVAESLVRPELPFFIRWHESDLHPSRLPAGDARSGRIAWIELHADLQELSSWLGTADLPLRTGEGPRPICAAGVSFGSREIVLS